MRTVVKRLLVIVACCVLAHVALAQGEKKFPECHWHWTTQGGKIGYKVSSKTNGNSIFLPAAGFRHGTTFNKIDSDGYYWSSDLRAERSEDARYMFFASDQIGWSDGARCGGFTIRPVTK